MSRRKGRENKYYLKDKRKKEPPPLRFLLTADVVHMWQEEGTNADQLLAPYCNKNKEEKKEKRMPTSFQIPSRASKDP